MKFHHGKNSRRNPFLQPYLPKRCAEHRTPRAGTFEECKFAHTGVEIRYHPLNYRMIPCNAGQDCKSLKCAYSHDNVLCQKKNDLKDKLFKEYNKFVNL